MTLESYCHKLQNLKTGRIGNHERPHKPVTLLAIMSLMEADHLIDNCIEYGPELVGLFKRYFAVVRDKDDAVNTMDPFWRLRTDGIISHQPQPGQEAVVQAMKSAPSVAQLQEITSYSSLEPGFYDLLQDPQARDTLRQALINRYFPDKAAELARLISEEQSIAVYEQQLETGEGHLAEDIPEFVRDSAFRRVVCRAYDHSCAACGIRVIVDELTIVDAAHLIPFHISHDDCQQSFSPMVRLS